MSYARAPPGAGGAAPGDYNYLRSSQGKDSKGGWPQSTAAASGEGPKELTETDVQFLSRMEGDTQSRRRDQYVNELKKHPLFRPGMLEPPKPKFKTVSLDAGPIIKSHERNKTGLETKKPYKWGPLGGYY
mmetsp:Transcript_60446/g.165570  ORF Transcript_60446/g.165570 Transcript_60446/m.165570 type:complete len:130 (+) Transcript_60446:102-491(+)